MLVKARYEARLQEETAVRETLENSAALHAGNIRELQRKVANVRAMFKAAEEDPLCAEWAGQPIGCGLGE